MYLPVDPTALIIGTSPEISIIKIINYYTENEGLTSNNICMQSSLIIPSAFLTRQCFCAVSEGGSIMRKGWSDQLYYLFVLKELCDHDYKWSLNSSLRELWCLMPLSIAVISVEETGVPGFKFIILRFILQ